MPSKNGQVRDNEQTNYLKVTNFFAGSYLTFDISANWPQNATLYLFAYKSQILVRTRPALNQEMYLQIIVTLVD